MNNCIYLDIHPMTNTRILCTNPELNAATKGNNVVCIRGSSSPDVLCPHYEGRQSDEKTDAVNHPNHYCQGGIECIKAIEAAMPPEGFQDYCKGNVLKYIWRWRDKAGVEDLKKARVYLNWMIESAEKEKTE